MHIFQNEYNIFKHFIQNRSTSLRIHRAGGSLSLSEQEYDSDELELPLSLKSAPKSRSIKDPITITKQPSAES